MKILLINPPVLSILEPWYDSPDFGRVGLACLAAYLRVNNSFKLKIIDAKFQKMGFDSVLKEVLKWQPDIVGFTAFTNEIKPAAYQAALIKKEMPSVITVIGGVHVTALPLETMLEFPYFDLAVIGEGELTFNELCQKLNSGEPYESIQGIAYRHGNEVELTESRKRVLDCDHFPLPAWDLLPPAQTYFIQTIRGCPYDCLFCMNPNGRVARKRSIESVIEEMLLLINNFNPKRISFGDELWSIDMDRSHSLLDAMIQNKIGENVDWDVQTHVKYVDFDLLSKMKQANVSRVELGIETGDESTLKGMGKGTNFEMIFNAVKAARKAKVKTGMFFLFGHPNESLISLRKTIDIAVKANPDLPMFGLMTPYPGTEVAKIAAEGKSGYKLLTNNWDEYNKQIGGALEFSNLSRAQIEFYQLLAYAKVFLFNGRIIDFVKFIFEYRVGAFNVLKKLFSRNKSISDLQRKPKDYDEILSSGVQINSVSLITARKSWRETQKKEMLRAKKVTMDD